ncbi:hypothetical protein [Leptolyngbya sp. CCY15150]|uniref:hypothetical protein n=1 Tax=Leptolyngbya sp. CCY15150 TaxID=2767772 RepID=UPI001950E721|nr:hypothetical protein [Leptolyngbya sp. CCY15150]
MQDLQRLPSPDVESPPYSGEIPKSDRPAPISPSLPQLPSTDISLVDPPPTTIQPSLLTKLDQQVSPRDQSLTEPDSAATNPDMATDALDMPSLVQRSPLGAYQSLVPNLNMLDDVEDQMPELDDLPQDLTAAQQLLEKLPIPSQVTEGLNTLPTNTPSNWSSLEDLLGQTVQQERQNVTDGLTKTEPWSDYFEQQSPITETLMSPMTALRSEVDNSSLTTFINPMTQALPQMLEGGGDIDAQQLEVLAQVVYLLLRDRLSLEQERQSFHTFTPLPWLNVVSHSNTALTSGQSKKMQSLERINIVLIGHDLQAGTQLADLCQEVYYMIHLRLQREQERLGLYSSS